MKNSNSINLQAIEADVIKQWLILQQDLTFTDPTLDHEFKRLFATPGNEDLLLMLIDIIIPEKQITSVTLGNQENYSDSPQAKKTIFDVKCTTQSGTTIVVEMQVIDKGDFSDRMLCYSTSPIHEQIMRGSSSYALTPVIMISITRFCLNNESTTDNAINCFRILNDGNRDKPFTVKLMFVTLELPKFLKAPEQISNDRERFIWLLKNMSSVKQLPEEFHSKKFEKLLRLANSAAMTQEQQIEYTRNFLAALDRNSELNTATNKGIAIGKEQEREKAFLEKLDSARKLKQSGVPTDVISLSLGLSQKEIELL